MNEDSSLTLESNGLLDFFPTPPLSTENDDQLPTQADAAELLKRPPRRQEHQDDYDAPPPEYDEEPSDFEDEMMDIMEREQESISLASSFRSTTKDGMDDNISQHRPLASCKQYRTICGGIAS